MVRLKETLADFNRIDWQISIPYGAIKSCLLIKFYLLQSWISIPYGAIKRHVVYDALDDDLRFQFLMVRLKVIA